MNKTLLIVCLLLSTVASANNLDQQLELQFEQYKNTQTHLRQEVIERSLHMSRASFETLVDKEKLEQSQIEQLRARQKREIEQAKTEAVENSVIKLDEFRDQRLKVKKFCQGLPKGAMLHVHPDGTMDRDTVRELLQQANPKVNGPYLKKSAVDQAGFSLYDDEIEFLNSLTPTRRYSKLSSEEQLGLQELFFLPQEPYTHDFSRFMSFFFIKGIVHRRQDDDRSASANKIYEDFFKRAQKQKVIYVEFTAAIQPKAWALEPLKSWAQMAKKYGVTARWNISFYRNNDAHKNEEQMKAWIAFLKDLETKPIEVVGIDFLADESTNPALEQGQGIYIQALQANVLNRTMHAGELGHPNNVRDAMIMGVNRVGHGVKLWQDPVALEYARKINLGIEINLVSNIRLRVIDDIKTHPFVNFHRLGLPISFSTDDEGLFETTMNKECEVAVENSDIQYSELKKIAFDGLRTSFAEPAVKAQLINELQNSFEIFEATYE